MAYCSECGSHNDESCLICEICGHDLSVTDEIVADQVDTGDTPEPVMTDISLENQTSTETDGDYAASDEPPAAINDNVGSGKTLFPEEKPEKHGSAGLLFSQDEAQLGKGLIKPTNIQLGMDGYHFTYEKSNPHLSKAESFTETGTAEKRVVNPDIITGSDSAVPFNQNVSEPVDFSVIPDSLGQKSTEDDLLITIAGKTEDDFEAEAIHPEAAKADSEEIREEKSSKTEASEIIEPTMKEIEDSGVQTVPEVVEDEAKEEAEYTILVGRQTWFGVPLPGTYQVTNKAVTVTDHNNQTQQISLDAIIRVALHQSILARLLGIGNLKLIPKKAEVNPLIITGVVRPKDLVKKIESLLQ